MKTKQSLFFCAVAALLAGCSTTIALNKVEADSKQQVRVKDERSAQERVYRRDSVRDPIQYFGDEDFDSPPLAQFSLLLGQKLRPGAYDLEVKKFRIIDVFPQRMGAATEGALAGALGSMGYSVYFSGASSLTQDNITCLISGRFQSKPVEASVSVPYRISPMAGMVKADSAFKEAVNACLGRLAEKIAA
jgi:hypothetical protein